MTEQPHANQWLVYLLRCRDSTLYCGITNNLEQRLSEHNAGRGAKYTRGRSPVTLFGIQPCEDRASALRLELRVKAAPRAKKLDVLHSPER